MITWHSYKRIFHLNGYRLANKLHQFIIRSSWQSTTKFINTYLGLLENVHVYLLWWFVSVTEFARRRVGFVALVGSHFVALPNVVLTFRPRNYQQMLKISVLTVITVLLCSTKSYEPSSPADNKKIKNPFLFAPEPQSAQMELRILGYAFLVLLTSIEPSFFLRVFCSQYLTLIQPIGFIIDA